MWSFWRAKGGAGCSVISAATAIVAARRTATLLVDLDGDQPALLGLTAADRGVADWLAADSPPADALRRLEIPVGDRLSVLPLGGDAATARSDDSERVRALTDALLGDDRLVVADAGGGDERFEPVFAHPARSVLVTRSCYLALHRRLPRRPDRVVIVQEAGRSLRSSDVATATGAPVAAVIDWDPAVARAVDAGLLARRLPGSLRRLRELLDDSDLAGGRLGSGAVETAAGAVRAGRR